MNTELIDKAIDERKGIWGGKPGNDYLYKLSHKVNSFSYASDRLEYHGQDFICTRAEFEARVAERQGKPSWKYAPDWVKWRGQDYRGWWAWFEEKPDTTEKGSYDMSDAVWAESTQGETIIPWQYTLEARPVEDKNIEKGDQMKKFKANDYFTTDGLSNDIINLAAIVAGKQPCKLIDPLEINTMTYVPKLPHLRQSVGEMRGGQKHTISEWLFKTAPDWAELFMVDKNGNYLYSDKAKIHTKGVVDGNYTNAGAKVIATREPATPKSPVQITDDGISVLGEAMPINDHPLANEIKEKIKSGKIPITGSIKQPYMPEVGEECSAPLIGEYVNATAAYHDVNSSGVEVTLCFNCDKSFWCATEDIRPIQSEKEKFVQAAMEINNRMIDADMNDTSLIFGAVFEELVDKPT